MSNPLGRQVGGRHYLDAPMQPAEVIHAFGLDKNYWVGNAVCMLLREKGSRKLGIEKAIQWLELELHYNHQDKDTSTPAEPQVKVSNELDNVQACSQPPANSNGRPFLHVLRGCMDSHELDSQRNTVADLLASLHADDYHDTARTVIGIVSTHNLTNSVKLGPFFSLITTGPECKECG